MVESTAGTAPLDDEGLLQRLANAANGRLGAFLKTRDMSLTVRDSSSTTSSSDAVTTSCRPQDTTGPCERMVAASPNTTTIPVVLGVVIPLLFAFVLLIILHRRHVKRLRREDAEDKHKSLDFGMEEAVVPEKRQEKKKWGKASHKAPEMSAAEIHHHGGRDRGLSMDLSIANPYLLPPELQGSRESLHSLSRSIHNGDDKYRATNFIPDDGSLRSPSSLRHHDDASIYTYSSRQRTETESTRGLLPNVHSQANEPIPAVHKPIHSTRDHPSLLAPATQDTSRESYVSTASDNVNITAMRASNNYLGQFISGGARQQPPNDQETKVATAELEALSLAAEVQEPPPAVLRGTNSKRQSILPDTTGFNFDIPPNTYELSSGTQSDLPHFDITPAQPAVSDSHESRLYEPQLSNVPNLARTSELEIPGQAVALGSPTDKENVAPINAISHYEEESDYYDEEAEYYNEARDTLGYDPRRSIMGLRPLPPDDPTENPEERALRIRSFYKEYFDETTKPGGEKARLSYFDGSENYIDDYYGSYDQPTYGHESYAYSSYGYGSRGPSYMSAMSTRGPPGRHRATFSNGSYMSGGYTPRAHSSASGRLAASKPRFAPKKKLPPPAPLPILPSPSMLKDDSMLPNAVDFAPPQLFKNQRAGTPDSLRGGLRPFSPSTRAHNPLVSSFDDLSVLPSPHQLRKSGTFTSLDFAPPRFAAPANGSDSGSIRSNRSGMSAMQLHHIRAGAYRLSRVPKEVAGTKDELAQALRPQWNAR